MTIKNRNLVFSDEKVNINRAAIEHRATWMGLTYDEGLKAGTDAEAIARAAIKKTGNRSGCSFKASMADPANIEEFSGLFLTDLTKTSFQMDVVQCDADNLQIEFHYCPLVNAWQKLGFDEETITKLCDIAMDGDRGIAESMGYKLELTDTIAAGCNVCKLHFHK